MLDKAEEEMEEDPPYGLGFLWDWFLDLNNSRQSDMGESQPITYQEIEAWKAATGASPTSWQVRAIRLIDDTYIMVERQKERKRPDPPAKPPEEKKTIKRA